jgi:hypothetical protein
MKPDLPSTTAKTGFSSLAMPPEPLLPSPTGWEHREGVNGQRLPDVEVVLEDGSRTSLYRLFDNGRWVRLQTTSDEKTSSDASTIVSANLAPGENNALFADLASVLVRPDGYIAHIRLVAA